MTEHTIKSLISSGLAIQALEHLDVPLGGALVINTGDDNDGTATWDMDAPDLPEVLSKLLGIAIAHHAVETLVMPSNADRLDEVHEFLELVNSIGVAKPLTLGEYEDRLEDFLYDIESVQQNLRP